MSRMKHMLSKYNMKKHCPCSIVLKKGEVSTPSVLNL